MCVNDITMKHHVDLYEPHVKIRHTSSVVIFELGKYQFWLWLFVHKSTIFEHTATFCTYLWYRECNGGGGHHHTDDDGEKVDKAVHGGWYCESNFCGGGAKTGVGIL